MQILLKIARGVLFSLLAVVAMTQNAFSDTRNAFIQKYLDNPYCKVSSSDFGFTGDLHWNYQGPPLTFLVVYYEEIKWIQGSNGMVDLVLPVGYGTSPGLSDVKNHYLIFHNTGSPVIIHTSSGNFPQHWDPNPVVQDYNRTANSYPANGIIVNVNYYNPNKGIAAMVPFGTDLNGDGLADNGTMSFSTIDRTFNGVLLNFNHININVGYGSVADEDIPLFVRDTRLGYIAAFANTAFEKSDLTVNAGQNINIQSNITALTFTASKTSTNIPAEMDFGITTRQAFIPNLYCYNLGIQLGVNGATTYLSKVKAVSDQLNLYKTPLVTFTGYTHPTKSEADQLVSDLTAAGNGAALNSFNTNTATIDIFRPVKLDGRYNALAGGNGSAALVGVVALKSIFLAMDSTSVIPTNTPDQFFFNSSRVVGMSLAFLKLMTMRSVQNYNQLLQSGNVGGVIEQLAKANRFTLASLSGVDTLDKTTATDFVKASISSGYNDLAAMVINDTREAAYEQAQQDDLQKMKNYFGAEIPGLASATTIDDAIGSIGGFISTQKQEIARLNDVINGLQATVTQLNTLLTNANNLIVALQQDAAAAKAAINNVSNKAGGALDGIKHLADAGAGFIIAGPVGAAICFFFC